MGKNHKNHNIFNDDICFSVLFVIYSWTANISIEKSIHSRELNKKEKRLRYFKIVYNLCLSVYATWL